MYQEGLSWISPLRFCVFAIVFGVTAAGAERPNILWISSEDNGPEIGAYGDSYATTPNLDALAAEGMLYRNAWSTAPVCAPSRTTVISGLYPFSTGSQHMRSRTHLPDGFRMFPQYLREAGYYCTNNSKEDYNLDKPGQVWDESSGKAHWRKRDSDQPFFAVFNLEISHESQIRRRPHTPVHDPAKVRVPAYHPDTPEVRLDWAQYYDNLTVMDAQAGDRVRELAEAGLAEDTIIFYWGDHGSGMPRGKRWLYSSGLTVPLIIYVPEKWRHLAPSDYARGGASDRLVGFIDFAPTTLSIAGIEAPSFMQGNAFMGEHSAPPSEYLLGFRDRMDERIDMSRAVRDQRFHYIRNFMPHRPQGVYLDFMFRTPTTAVWHRLFEEGKLTPEQAQFFEAKPPEELFDIAADPDQVWNLADDPEYAEDLIRLRKRLHRFQLDTRDLGLLPEGEIHSRSEGVSPYEMAQSKTAFDVESILEIAEIASGLSLNGIPALNRSIGSRDSAVRYWAAQGMLMRGEASLPQSLAQLRVALEDPSPHVRIVAAEALGRYGPSDALEPSLDVLLELANVDRHGPYVSVAALNALDWVVAKAPHRVEEIRALPQGHPSIHGRYIPRLINKILRDF